MADKTISVGYNTEPLLKFVLTDFRNESDASAVVDITSYNFKLSVKRLETDADSLLLVDLAGAIVTAASGIFSFQLTTEHTTLPPGTYAAKISWWAGAVSSKPKDSWTVDYVVTAAIDNAFV